MSSEPTAKAIMNHEYLPMRAKILEMAAALDRLQRAEGEFAADPRHEQLRAAIELLIGDKEGRAERVQLLFSRPYDHQWRAALQLSR